MTCSACNDPRVPSQPLHQCAPNTGMIDVDGIGVWRGYRSLLQLCLWLEDYLELLSEHHVALHLELAAHERLHGVEFPANQVDQSLIAQRQRALCLVLTGTL